MCEGERVRGGECARVRGGEGERGKRVKRMERVERVTGCETERVDEVRG